MSQANAAAIRRRANPINNTPTPGANPAQSQSQDQPNVNSAGLTLPQVIAVIDRRLINIETFVKESKSQSLPQQQQQVNLAPVPENSEQFSELFEEYNHRFEVLADEIANMKDIVLKLQSYTMDVNKALMDERIHVFSDLGSNAQVQTELTEEQEDDAKTTSIDLRNLVKEELLSDE
jgi:hypothetical protein